MDSIDKKSQFVYVKTAISPMIDKYETQYRHYSQGDFGELNQIIFESQKKGGNIDVWGMGWLGIFVWDYVNDEALMNVLIEPEKELEQREALSDLRRILSMQ